MRKRRAGARVTKPRTRRLAVARHGGHGDAFTLGWLVTSAYGALYQLAPVVLGVRLKSLGLARLVLFLHTLGTGLLVAGLGLWNPVSIAAGWTFVAAALAIWTWNIGGRIARAPRSRLIAAHITAAYAAFWITLGLAGVRIGNTLVWWMVPREPLVAAHVQLAAVGFAGVLVMGLGSRLFPMFLMNRNASEWPLRWCGAFALAGVLLQVSGWLGAVDGLVSAGGVVRRQERDSSFFRQHAGSGRERGAHWTTRFSSSSPRSSCWGQRWSWVWHACGGHGRR